MSQLIKNQAIVTANEEILTVEDCDLNKANIIVPLVVYLENLEALKARDDVGVWLDSDEEADSLETHIASLKLIALNFPSYLDGRAYSTATLIRRDFGYRGELRAIGDVRRDQLEQMARCGFDAFSLAGGQNIEASLKGLQGFSHHYQTSIDSPEPLFRTR